jgi:small conductance mechanosensitive channel
MPSLLHSLHELFPSKTLVTGLIELLKLVLVAAIIYLALGRLVRAAVAASSRRITHPAHRQRATTLLLLVGNIARYVFIFVVGYWAIQKLFGFDMTPVLASVGVVGLAVGFGAQNLVRDIVSGFFIIMEGQYGIGDLVEINGVFGQVEEVGLRITKLRDPNGELRYFSNGTITSVNRYTEGHLPYTLNVPRSDPGPVLRALADFDQEFKVFAALPEAGAPVHLDSYAQVLPVALRIIPGRQALLTEKLPPRLTAALARGGHPLPEGTEITLTLAYQPKALSP